MNDKKTPTRQLKVEIFMRSGGSLRGYVNIRGFDRLMDFLENKANHFIPFTKDQGGMQFCGIPKNNVAWITEI